MVLQSIRSSHLILLVLVFLRESIDLVLAEGNAKGVGESTPKDRLRYRALSVVVVRSVGVLGSEAVVDYLSFMDTHGPE